MSGSAKILFVEDENDLREIFKDHFTRLGFIVTLAKDGREGSKLLDKDKFDIIVSDIQLPGLNGIDMINTIKTSSQNKRSKIIIMSGMIDDEVRERANSLNIAHLIDKPASMQDLEMLVRSILPPDLVDLSYSSGAVGCFTEACSELIEFYFNEKATIGTPYNNEIQSRLGDVTSTISLLGDGIIGLLSLTANYDFFVELNKRLFGGTESSLAQELYAELAGEMVNQMSGMVQKNFSKLGIALRVTLPQTICGRGSSITVKGTTTVSCPVQIGNVRCYVEFSLNQQVEQSRPANQKIFKAIWGHKKAS